MLTAMPGLVPLGMPAFIIALAAFLTLRADSLDLRRVFLWFKPLTTILILLYAATALEGLFDKRGLLIVGALLASLAGDILLMFPKYFLPGLASFLLAHLAYTVAFLTGISSTGLLLIALPLTALALIILALLWGQLGKLKLPVLVYVLAIVMMAYQAGERWLELSTLSSLLAFLGALLFMLSDALLAFNRFRQAFAGAQLAILGSYYAAQWLIALSLHLRLAS
jgi:uncharacterized membrane protein YhhN